MTLLGKVFTGLIFLMSIVFFTFSVAVNASHVNTKVLAQQYQAEARATQERNRQLETLKTNYKTELEIEQLSRRSALAALQTQFEATNYNLLQLEIEAGELRKAMTIAAQTNDSTQKDFRDAAAQNRRLREEIEGVRQQRDQLFQTLVDAKDEFNQMQGVYQSLSDRADMLGVSDSP